MRQLLLLVSIIIASCGGGGGEEPPAKAGRSFSLSINTSGPYTVGVPINISINGAEANFDGVWFEWENSEREIGIVEHNGGREIDIFAREPLSALSASVKIKNVEGELASLSADLGAITAKQGDTGCTSYSYTESGKHNVPCYGEIAYEYDFDISISENGRVVAGFADDNWDYIKLVSFNGIIWTESVLSEHINGNATRRSFNVATNDNGYTATAFNSPRGTEFAMLYEGSMVYEHMLAEDAGSFTPFFNMPERERKHLAITNDNIATVLTTDGFPLRFTVFQFSPDGLINQKTFTQEDLGQIPGSHDRLSLAVNGNHVAILSGSVVVLYVNGEWTGPLSLNPNFGGGRANFIPALSIRDEGTLDLFYAKSDSESEATNYAHEVIHEGGQRDFHILPTPLNAPAIHDDKLAIIGTCSEIDVAAGVCKQEGLRFFSYDGHQWIEHDYDLSGIPLLDSPKSIEEAEFQKYVLLTAVRENWGILTRSEENLLEFYLSNDEGFSLHHQLNTRPVRSHQLSITSNGLGNIALGGHFYTPHALVDNRSEKFRTFILNY